MLDKHTTMPVFGPNLSANLHRDMINHFEAEMRRFTPLDAAEMRDDPMLTHELENYTINILHLTTSQAMTRPEMLRVAGFMKERGFEITRDPNVSLRTETDMLSLGAEVECCLWATMATFLHHRLRNTRCDALSVLAGLG